MKFNILSMVVFFSFFTDAQCDFTTNIYQYPSGHGISCYGVCDGSVDVTPTGTAPFSYSWSSGESTEDLANKCAGVYTLTMTDNNGCVITDSIELIQPDTLEVFLYILTPVSAPGMCDGGLSAFFTGGAGFNVYFFLDCAQTFQVWDPTNNMCEGEWYVMTVDQNGCIAESCFPFEACEYFADNNTIGGLDCALSSTAPYIADSYQWLDCDNSFAILPGDTTYSCNTLNSGNVALQVTVGGCVDTSECVFHCIWGLDELSNSKKELVKISDILGRQTEDKSNIILIYIYSDGTKEKVFRIE